MRQLATVPSGEGQVSISPGGGGPEVYMGQTSFLVGIMWFLSSGSGHIEVVE